MWIAETYCVAANCHCEHRNGVILARCATRTEAVAVARQQCPRGYRWRVYFQRPQEVATY